MIVTEKDAARISSRIVIEPTSGCWLYPSTQKDGYARVRIAGRKTYAHRATYTYCLGPIPDSMTLDHVRAWGCVHRNCCNPGHLEPVPHRENVMRGTSFAATHAAKEACEHGHPFTPENTLPRKNGHGRICRECAKQRLQRFKERNPQHVEEYARRYHNANRARINARSQAWRDAKKAAGRPA